MGAFPGYATAAQGQKADTALQTVDAAWPVGAVMVTSVETNPEKLLGFGTWEQLKSETLFYWERTK